VLLAFDFTSWYAALAYVAAAYLLWRAFAGQLVADARTVKRKLKPDPPEPQFPPPVFISEQISTSISLAQDADAPHRHLSRISPRYEIHNGGADRKITDVTTGVRRRGFDTGGHQFDWYASDIRPLDHRTVENVEIPPEMFRDVHESVNIEAFVVWARFTDVTGRVWEVTRDAHTKAAGSSSPRPRSSLTRRSAPARLSA
jgi:hypothetical protein